MMGSGTRLGHRYYWGERERAPTCGLNGRAVPIYSKYIYGIKGISKPHVRITKLHVIVNTHYTLYRLGLGLRLGNISHK